MRLRVLLLSLFALLLFPAIAFAQSGPIPTGLSLGAMLAFVGCMAASYALRRVTPAGGFFHTPAGAFVISGLAAVLSAIQPAIAAHGLNAQALYTAALGALASLLATSNPSTPIGQKPVMARPPGSAGTIAAALVFLAMIPCLSACAGATVWGACTLGQLPAIAQPLIPEVIQDLAGVSEAVAIQQLEALGSALAPGQLACVVQAVVADIAAKTAELSANEQRIVSNGHAFLAKHPACCGVKK